MTEVDEKTLAFEFDNERDREQILDLSPWSVQGHCLNLKVCRVDGCLEEMNFNLMQIWIQIYGQSLDMYNTNIGRCISVESEEAMHQRSLLRLKIEINGEVPLMTGFWWANSVGQYKWATIKYETLSGFCYECGMLENTSQHCGEEVVMSELKPGYPRYSAWLFGLSQRTNKWYHVGE